MFLPNFRACPISACPISRSIQFLLLPNFQTSGCPISAPAQFSGLPNFCSCPILARISACPISKPAQFPWLPIYFRRCPISGFRTFKILARNYRSLVHLWTNPTILVDAYRYQVIFMRNPQENIKYGDAGNRTVAISFPINIDTCHRQILRRHKILQNLSRKNGRFFLNLQMNITLRLLGRFLKILMFWAALIM